MSHRELKEPSSSQAVVKVDSRLCLETLLCGAIDRVLVIRCACAEESAEEPMVGFLSVARDSFTPVRLQRTILTLIMNENKLAKVQIE